ncbi:cupin domain-containing protein [Streptosporangium sp. NPDC050855]|uniref:cupin domain-containing protein n=1 Tax=Streptosporangium sp. NPDC050855 TaxID=3366194 RepID=UPI0037AFE251
MLDDGNGVAGGDEAVGGLATLLAPVGLREFFGGHHESAPLYVPGAPGRFRELPQLADVDFLLTATVSDRIRPGDGERLVRSEAGGGLTERRVRTLSSFAVDVQAVYRAYDDGFTLIVNRLHRRHDAVARLCRELQAQLRFPVGANLYLTPARSQGFLPHADSHDVYILQLHGSKVWHVSAPETELPLRTEPGGPRALPEPEIRTLTPGDVLYLPRGWRHAALTGETSSMHLTVGVEAYTWHDYLTVALDVLAESDVAFRAALPRSYFDGPVDPDQMDALTARLASALDDSGVRARARDRLCSRLSRQTLPTGFQRFASLDALPALHPSARILRDPGITCVVRTGAAETTIEFLGNHVTGPTVVASALAFIAAETSFTVADLPGPLTDTDRLDLVRRLISEGLLEVDPK